jgi:hypothetical protein
MLGHGVHVCRRFDGSYSLYLFLYVNVAELVHDYGEITVLNLKSHTAAQLKTLQCTYYTGVGHLT